MFYRFYLLDSDGRIRGAESFCASDETEAKQVAATVYEACSDVCYGYELWCGPERIVKCERKLSNDGSLRRSEVRR